MPIPVADRRRPRPAYRVDKRFGTTFVVHLTAKGDELRGVVHEGYMPRTTPEAVQFEALFVELHRRHSNAVRMSVYLAEMQTSWSVYTGEFE